MKKNGTELYSSNTRQKQINLIKLKYLNSNINNTMNKFNFSKNNKNKVSSNFTLYKNSQLSNNNFKDISHKNEINSISNNKIVLEEFIESCPKFPRKLSAKNIRTKDVASNTCNMNNNNYIIHRVTIQPDKKRKIDFIKYKFLLEQKNYYKRLFLYDDFGSSSSYYSKNIKPSLRKNPKRNHLNSDKLKKIFFEQDNTNLPSMKDGKENFSFSSFKASKNSFYKQNISGMNNYSDKKNKNYNTTILFKKQNELFFNYKNNIPIKNDNLIEKSKMIKENKNNTVNIQAKKIVDNYNEYLKGISSSESNKIRKLKIINKNEQVLNKSIKPLNNKLLSNDKSEIFQNIKRLNNYYYSNIIIKNNKKLLELKKNRKNFNNITKSFSKSFVIENPFLRKK